MPAAATVGRRGHEGAAQLCLPACLPVCLPLSKPNSTALAPLQVGSTLTLKRMPQAGLLGAVLDIVRMLLGELSAHGHAYHASPAGLPP